MDILRSSPVLVISKYMCVQIVSYTSYCTSSIILYKFEG